MSILLRREGRGMRHLVEGEGEGERGDGLLVMTTEAEFSERGRRRGEVTGGLKLSPRTRCKREGGRGLTG